MPIQKVISSLSFMGVGVLNELERAIKKSN